MMRMMRMRVIGIESSCDETAASVVEDGVVLSDVVASQIAHHRPYGGVVPEIASRHHMINIVPVIQQALLEAGVSLADLDGVAATAGPGLKGALLVGLQAAKSLAVAGNLPFVGVNHLKGHLLSARIKENGSARPGFPYMALLASGGHTGVYLVENENRIDCLGATRDDAAGEAFDKVAKVMGLGYPGGPVIDRLASEPGEEVAFPQAFRDRRSYEFSFSGVKTAVAQHVAGLGREPTADEVRAIAKGFQNSVVSIMVRKVTLAARAHQVPRIVLAGGVAANQGLARHAAAVCAEMNLELFVPPPKRCTDNGSMIAYVGLLALAAGERSGDDISPLADWPVEG
jgi:N6-L-threonylcarbamoyladenine synthase